MQCTFLVVAGVVLVASALSPLAAAQTLPVAIQADRATVRQDATEVHNAFAQLKADEQAGNAAAAAADRTALRLARLQARLDFGKLHQDAQGVMQTDQTTLMAALRQLHADQTASNSGAILADQAAVQNAEAQLRADRSAVFGDLGMAGMHHRHGRG